MIAQKQEPEQYGALFDSISVCLSKGLGCPVGSLLVGNKDYIHQALRVRKVLGGGMRQAGYLAAAGIYALDHHRERLAEDHRRARELASILSEMEYVEKVEPVETNIIIFEMDESQISADAFIDKLRENQILIIGMGQGKLRMVTHLDYTESMHNRVMEILSSLNKIGIS